MNKKNYQRLTEELMYKKNNIGKKILLHSCCAPCSSHVLLYLRKYLHITVFYYNPNITDREEYAYRKAEQLRLINELNLETSDTGSYNISVLDADYQPEVYIDAVKGHETEPEGGERCRKCFRLRLKATAKAAKEGGFDFFTTTLTISPLKNAEVLNDIGYDLAEEYGVEWLPSDFKKKEGYKHSIELSHKYGLYRQDYCGCGFSKAEAERRKAEREDREMIVEKDVSGKEKETGHLPEVKRIMLKVSYDGTAYHGWQLQPGAPTISGEIKKALTSLYGREVELIGGSRTDSGVHALGNITAFDIASPIPAERIAMALNARLPEDIRIISSRQVDKDFHPLRIHSSKTYIYRIYCGRVRPPIYRTFTYHIYDIPDFSAMNEAAAHIIGEHDFTSFCAAGAQVSTKVRTVYECSVSREALRDDSLLTIKVNGDGFLYNMVRIIAGTLLQVGRGKLATCDIDSIIAAKDRSLAGPTLPPEGLILEGWEGFYKQDR